MADVEGGPAGSGRDETIEEEEQADDDSRRESDLGYEQRRRYREEGETGGQELGSGDPEPGTPLIEDTGAEVDVEGDDELLADAPDETLEEMDTEMAEDLRRAEPNPPMSVEQVDAKSDVDYGFLEDEDTTWDGDVEDEGGPVNRDAVDPLEAEREAQDRPGRSPGPLPGDLDFEDEEEKGGP